jgi:hypothetical protein
MKTKSIIVCALLGFALMAFVPRDTEPKTEIVKTEIVAPVAGEMTALYEMTTVEFEKYKGNMDAFKELKPRNVIADSKYKDFVAKFNLERRMNKAECPGGTCCTYYQQHKKCYVCFFPGGGVMLATEICETCVGCGFE